MFELFFFVENIFCFFKILHSPHAFTMSDNYTRVVAIHGHVPRKSGSSADCSYIYIVIFKQNIQNLLKNKTSWRHVKTPAAPLLS